MDPLRNGNRKNPDLPILCVKVWKVIQPEHSSPGLEHCRHHITHAQPVSFFLHPYSHLFKPAHPPPQSSFRHFPRTALRAQVASSILSSPPEAPRLMDPEPDESHISGLGDTSLRDIMMGGAWEVRTEVAALRSWLRQFKDSQLHLDTAFGPRLELSLERDAELNHWGASLTCNQDHSLC